jgi:DNA invertase Pin-like site-specific DNA recombinase
MIVALYARVSTKDKDQNPENQLIKLRDYSRKRDWEYREYVDYSSGAKLDCEGLQSMMARLDEFDGIIVLRLDRFGRSLRNLLDLLDKIRKNGKSKTRGKS